jgi:nucleoid DNA-binding protein
MGTMKRDLLSKRLSVKLCIPLPLARSLVNSLLARLRETLQADEVIKIREFGTFGTRLRAAGQGRNPRSGQPYPVSARRVVTFKPGKRLREAVAQSTARVTRCPSRVPTVAWCNQRELDRGVGTELRANGSRNQCLTWRRSAQTAQRRSCGEAGAIGWAYSSA